MKSKAGETAKPFIVPEPFVKKPESAVKKIVRGKRLVYILIAIAAISVIGAIYAFTELNSLKDDPQQIAQEEANQLIAQIGKLIVLPTDESPTVATVSDVEKLQDQPFFAHAKNGDKVLIYAQTRKAILYDPVANKIVDVAPVNLGQPATNTQVPSTKANATAK